MSLNIALIRASFENVKPIAADVVTYFYDTLFSTFPESKTLFSNVDMEKQKKVLIGSLVKVVDGLGDLNSLGSYLQALGGRHVSYGVKEEHYAMVGKSLIMTFRHFFKDAWTSELEDQWITAIGFIAEQMIEGANQATKQAAKPAVSFATAHQKAEPQDLSHVVRQLARSILFKALEDEMDGEFMKAARKKAANILTQAIRDEAEQLQMNLEASKKRKIA